MNSPSTVYQHVHTTLKGKRCIAFDMDDTLISGTHINPYPYPGAKQKILQLVKDGVNIIIISNQKKPRNTDTIVKAKIKAVIEFYNVAMHFFCAREDDKYRKPNIGILDLIPKEYGKIELFVGDASNREGDHSDCDIAFAKSSEIPFITPEEYFNLYPTIERKEIPDSIKSGKINFLTMVILCGFPASGKTTYAEQTLKDFYRVSKDELKTAKKCIKVCQEKLSKGHNVVIDNLNATISDRERFISMAKEEGAIVVLIHFRTTMSQAQAWNKKREKQIPSVVYFKYRKEFELPTLKEGINEIFSIL